MFNISFSLDDGAVSDIKLAEYFMKYNIPCKLFVPTKNREGRDVLTPKNIQSLNNNLITFGGHTYSHVYLTTIPTDDISKEIDDNIKYLEDAVGTQISHFCLPGGKYNDQIIDLIKDRFESIRTADTMCSDFRGKIRKPTFHFYPRGVKSLIGNVIRNKDKMAVSVFKSVIKNRDYFDIIKSVLDYSETSKKDFYFHVWGHSWEIEELNLWDKLDMLLKFISTNYPKSIKDYNNNDFTTNKYSN